MSHAVLDTSFGALGTVAGVTVSTRAVAGSPAEVSVEAFLVPNAHPTDAQPSVRLSG